MISNFSGHTHHDHNLGLLHVLTSLVRHKRILADFQNLELVSFATPLKRKLHSDFYTIRHDDFITKSTESV